MFGGAIANMYKTSYTYDANGNIKNLQRYNAAGVKFDDMDYKYDVQGNNLISNKLYHVNDAIASGIHTANIDDEGTFQNNNNITTANNYTYDAIGNLTKDVSEQIQNIEWTVSGKIKKIIRTGISTKADLEYVYDAMGNRIAKILKPDGSSLENGGTDNPTQWTYTYYVRDAQGNIMANYQKSTSNSITSFKLIERSIYGSSRLGIDKTTIDLTASITPPIIFNHNLGLKNYELSNHLGNVTTVISDRKIPRSVLGTNINFYMPDIVSATDYYPFGMTMQERTFSACGEAYRFGFNGKENDNEISVDGGNLDFGARIYDSRLGRWMSIDPLFKDFASYSPYSAFNNNPIYFVDPDGKVGEASVHKVTSKKEAKRLGVKVDETIALVKANFILYGTQASNPNAQAAIPAAEKKWNDAKGTVTITDENGNTVTLAVRFLFTSTVVTQRQGEIEQEYVVRVTGVQGGAADIKNNFIRIEASTNLDGTNKSAMLGDNSGYYILSDLYTGSTTPSHEIGHGFGLPHSDLPLETTPDVMVPSGTEVAGGTTNPDSRIVTQKNIEDLNLGKILGNGNTKGGLGKRGGCMFFQDGSWGCSDAYNDNKNKKK